MDLNSLLNKKLIFFEAKPKNDVEAIKILGDKFIEEKYIKPEYTKTVVEREKNFPTGIVLESLGVAIPHASPENNVLKDGIAVLSLKEPIIFHTMEDADNEVAVSIVFMLALKENNEHLSMLQKLFKIFQNNELIKKLAIVSSAEEFHKYITEAI
ncbi:PTS sugar transporter subunit IIA [Pectinatus brassicae]|uniref:PTS system galactitol-specific IIA component n=1 Tax=Pectinatus brassicae TaxID=862415 RepID=A0A840URQ5_9FIRM|nr:PTS sugar transporter subunit IIA [Pectinatus brassicae]MBB5335514.1 PTS system galactitol-specific IIA component [Pectinatus brassicae]